MTPLPSLFAALVGAIVGAVIVAAQPSWAEAVGRAVLSLRGVVMLVAVVAGCKWLTRSRFGLALAMARQNPLRLTSMGIRPFNVRLTAFVLSAMAVALAGALYADLNRFVSPTMLSWHLSGELIIFVILGGVGRPCGPLIGACLYVLLEEWLGHLTDYWQLPLGLILLLVVLFARGGVVGLVTGRPSHA